MTDYTKSTNFATKDTLSPGSALKIVRGTEIDTEFNNIATAVATKADLASPALTGTPTAPTASVGDNDTSIATTAFVSTAVSNAVAAGFGFKNRIINGAMMIDQRNAGASVVVANNNAYVVDRFRYLNSAGSVTCQQSTTAPAGFSNSISLTVGSVNTPGAADFQTLRHIIEGLNVADFAWGTASATPITISFWVRSSVTGTYSVGLRNSALNRAYVATYSINAANTFEYKTITISGDTSGTWLTTNGAGIYIDFSFGTGSNNEITAGSWQASSAFAATGEVNWISNAGATFYITGVQLEKGSTATSFDYRPYGTELSLCQRYYQKSYNTDVAPGTNTTVGYVTFREYSTNTFLPNFATRLNTPLRATPTVITWYSTGGTSGSVSVGAGSNTVNTAYDYGMNSSGWILINGSVSSGSQVGGHYVVSAEL